MPTTFFEPFSDYLRTSRGGSEPLAGVFVGGCVERGDGSSFRRKAHAHCAKGDKWRGWICVRSAKRLFNGSKPSLLMWHELTHILTNQGHTARFEAKMRELCGRSDIRGYRMRKAARRKQVAAMPTRYEFQRIIDAHMPSCTKGCGRRAEGYLVRFKGNGMRSDATCEPCARRVSAELQK